MTTKLTLSIDDRVIESAKKYASGKGTSLSGIVENYLKSITTKTTKDRTGKDIPQVIQKLRGSLKLPKNTEYKKELENALAKKYAR
jgi:Family of unknown function (DUF6364)